VQKSLVCLASAAANAKDDQKAVILGLQKIITGMLAAYRQRPVSDDPGKISTSLTNSAEYLMGGARGWATEEASGSLSSAIKSINASIDARRSGKDFASKLQAAVSFLLLTKEHLQASEINQENACTKMVGRAAQILQEAVAGADEQYQDGVGPAKAPCQDERAALLAIGQAMMTYSTDRIDEMNSILTWDDTLPPLPAAEEIDCSVSLKDGELSALPGHKSKEKARHPALDISTAEPLFQDVILADGSREVSISRDVSLGERPMPVKADAAFGGRAQITLPEEEPLPEEQLSNIELEIPGEEKEEMQMPGEAAFSGPEIESAGGHEESNDAEYANGNDEPLEAPAHKDEKPAEAKGHWNERLLRSLFHRNGGQEKAPNDQGYDPIHQAQALEDGIEDFGTLFLKAPRCSEVETESQVIIHPKVLFLLKAMTVLVAILLAIEAIIYLI
jgi:hypothetical protein